MFELSKDQLVDQVIESIAGENTASARQQLSNWAKGNPKRETFLQDMWDPVIASKEMAIWARFDPEKGYLRWRNSLKRKRKQLYVKIAKIAAVAALAAGAFALCWLWKSDIRPLKSPSEPVHALAQVQRSFEEQTLKTEGKSNPITVRELPDGTKVWLNSGSKLFYPDRFTGKRRVVELTGEAYFEVAHQSEPLVVKVKGMEIQALATRFDVMAYPKEDIVQATLIDGLINVRKGTSSVSLRPGQQITAAVRSDGLPAPQDVNCEEFIKWKENVFYFTPGGSLRTMLSRIARSYNLELKIDGNISDKQPFDGDIERSLPLGDVLKVLHVNNYTIVNNVLIIEPNKPA